MYKIIDCEQGSDEWKSARLGKITASVADKIITKTGKLSASRDEIVNRAVAELILGVADETFQSEAMLRGKELEDEALSYFNIVNNYNFKKCGFVDSGKGYGCSPDGIDEEIRKGLELKCPLAHTHLAYLADGGLPDKYIQQVQKSLLVTGFDSWIFGSYYPGLPCFEVEIFRDDVLLKPMEQYILETVKMIKEKHELLIKLVEAA